MLDINKDIYRYKISFEYMKEIVSSIVALFLFNVTDVRTILKLS